MEFLSGNKIEDGEYDLVILPPDLHVLSDEEEGNEDDLVSSTFPNDLPGTLEVISHRQNISDWDHRDDEPLCMPLYM